MSLWAEPILEFAVPHPEWRFDVDDISNFPKEILIGERN